MGLLLLIAGWASESAAASCTAPSWQSVFVLDPDVGCPGALEQVLPQPGDLVGAPAEAVCSRGTSGSAQLSAIVVEGWTYSQIRGTLKSYVMGSPDGLRPEQLRGTRSIDDAYMDGIALARWTATGRAHVASYAAGTSYAARRFSFYTCETDRNDSLHSCHGPAVSARARAQPTHTVQRHRLTPTRILCACSHRLHLPWWLRPAAGLARQRLLLRFGATWRHWL